MTRIVGWIFRCQKRDAVIYRDDINKNNVIIPQLPAPTKAKMDYLCPCNHKKIRYQNCPVVKMEMIYRKVKR